jgi:hypothetical protein
LYYDRENLQKNRQNRQNRQNHAKHSQKQPIKIALLATTTPVGGGLYTKDSL